MLPSRLFHSLLVLALLALGTSTAAALDPAKVTLTVDRNRLTLDDELELTVSVSGEADRLEPPDLDAFTVSQSRTERRVDFGRSSVFSQIYTLTPKRAGTFTLGPAKATLGGRVVAEAPPVTVVVAAAPAPTPITAAEAMNLDRLAQEPAFVRWHVPRTRFYIGEPFPLTLELWVRNSLQASNPELTQPPALDGLLVEDLRIDAAKNGTHRTLAGQRFDVYPLQTQLATPLKAGKLLLDAVTLRLGLGQGGFMSSPRRVTLTTEPFPIDILELPTQGRPKNFSPRNVGQFTLSARLVDDRGVEPTRVTTGQRLILRAEVRGQGNLIALEAPVLGSTQAAFDASPLSGTADDQIDKTQQGVSGTRVFQWILAAPKPGNFTTPEISLDVWDPIATKFVHLSAPGRPLEVTGTAITQEVTQATAIGEDVGPILEPATLTTSSTTPLSHQPLYWALLAVPLIAWAGSALHQRRRRRDVHQPGLRAARDAAHNAKRRLRAADRALKDGLVKDFYGQIARTLTSYLEERANLPATGMTHGELRAAAQQAGYPEDLIDAWVVEMENCDFARFAPAGGSPDRMREVTQRVEGLIARLDSVQPERRP